MSETKVAPKFKNGMRVRYNYQFREKEHEVVFFVPAGESIQSLAKKEKITLPPEVQKDVVDDSKNHRYLMRSIPEEGSKARVRYFTPTASMVDSTGEEVKDQEG
jgi:hypothetical protein